MVRKKKLKRFVPPAFFAMLAVSLVMWWLTQLSKDYAGVELPVTVKVEGNVFEVPCYASGSGYKLASHRLLHHIEVEVAFDELDVTPIAARPGWGIVNPAALAEAITCRVTDVKVERVGLAPEILLRGR
jgi:hypothetical protein